MAKKPKSANSFYFNNDTEAMRKANNALDRRGIPSAKRTKYITEMDIKSLSKKTKPYKNPYKSDRGDMPKPKGPKRPKKPTGSMDKDLRQFAKPMPKRIGKTMSEKAMIMPKRKQTKREALRKDIGPMGSTMEQRIESQKKMLADMRKRMMLRKKKGQ